MNPKSKCVIMIQSVFRQARRGLDTMTPRDFDRKEVRAINAKETVTITVRQTITTSIKIEKSTETKEHDDVSVIVVLVPRG